jgi:hypothetical protein
MAKMIDYEAFKIKLLDIRDKLLDLGDELDDEEYRIRSNQVGRIINVLDKFLINTDK